MQAEVEISSHHKVIVVPTREDLRNLFPHAKQLTRKGKECLVIPHGPFETKTLRTLGFLLPAGIATHYDWPGSDKPFDVQIKTCAMLTTNARAYVLSGFGTGKSKAALWSWDYLNIHGYAGKLLIIAPLSTLNFTWAHEVLNTLPHRECCVLHGAASRRNEFLERSSADIFIVNHDGLSIIEQALRKRPEINALVIDELAVYRNGSAERSRKLQTLANMIITVLPPPTMALNGAGSTQERRFRWVWGMTGSPTPNEPTDVWAQACIITPDRVPRYFSRFRDELMLKQGPFRWMKKPGAVERAYEALQPAVRFTLDDVVELPDCIERVVDVELGAKQKKVYTEMKNSAFALIQQLGGPQKVDAMNAGAVLSKLLQISTGWVYTRAGNTVALDNQKRLDQLLTDVNSTDRKVLVFVPFVHALQGVAMHLANNKIEVATISGDTSKTVRDHIFNRFQNNIIPGNNAHTLKVIVAHPQTMAHGLTLTEADTIIWFAPIASLEIFEQANARIRRVGQKHKQLVLMYQATDAERKLYARLRAKQRVQNMILELFEENNAET